MKKNITPSSIKLIKNGRYVIVKDRNTSKSSNNWVVVNQGNLKTADNIGIRRRGRRYSHENITISTTSTGPRIPQTD